MTVFVLLGAEVMSREHEATSAAATQLTEQLAVQKLAAKQALKQVSVCQPSAPPPVSVAIWLVHLVRCYLRLLVLERYPVVASSNTSKHPVSFPT